MVAATDPTIAMLNWTMSVSSTPCSPPSAL